MTAAREDQNLGIDDMALEDAGGRRTWLQPEVRRMSADSAESGSTVTTDIGVTFS